MIVLMMHFSGGATGYHASLAATGEQWRLACYGSRGWAELRDHRALAVRMIDCEETVDTSPNLDIERAELEAFADAIEGRANNPVMAGQAINNIAILEAVLQSAKTRTFISASDF